jgi:hypothetical protein
MKLQSECWKTDNSTQFGRVYYVNKETGKSQWGLPTTYIEELPIGWEKHMSNKTGRNYYGNAQTGQYQWDKPPKYYPEKEELPPDWSIGISNCGNIYYINNGKKISQWHIPTPEMTPEVTDRTPRFLKWVGNSCYLDSTLFAFLAGSKSFIHDFLNIDMDKYKKLIESNDIREVCGNIENGLEGRKAFQRELKRIDDSMRYKGSEVVNCTDLRATLKNCPGANGGKDLDPYWFDGIDKKVAKTLSKTNSRDGTAESGEFLRHILTIIPHMKASKTFVTYVTNEKGDNLDKEKLIKEGKMFISSETIDDQSSIIHFIDLYNLGLIDGESATDISSLLNDEEDSGPDSDIGIRFEGTKFRRRITRQTITDTPYLIVNVQRLTARAYTDAVDQRIIETPVYPNEYVHIGGQGHNQDDDFLSNTPFTLSAVVMNADAAHYTAIAKYGDFWYYYNDSPYIVKKYNTLDQVLYDCGNDSSMMDPITKGVQYYYKPLTER